MIYIVHYFDEGPIPPICFDEYNPSRCGVQLSNKKNNREGFHEKINAFYWYPERICFLFKYFWSINKLRLAFFVIKCMKLSFACLKHFKNNFKNG